MILLILIWQLILTIAVIAILLRLQAAQDSIIKFLLLVNGRDRAELISHLQNKCISITEDSKHSDYIRCEASKDIFERTFKCNLQWKELLVGGWEVFDGEISDELQKHNVKECLLYRNLMLPYKFIRDTTISK